MDFKNHVNESILKSALISSTFERASNEGCSNVRGEGGEVEKKVCIIVVETLIFARKTDTKVMCVCVGWCRMSPAPSI